MWRKYVYVIGGFLMFALGIFLVSHMSPSDDASTATAFLSDLFISASGVVFVIWGCHAIDHNVK